MMNTNLENYIFKIEKVFDKNFCTNTINSLSNYDWTQHHFYSPDKGYHTRVDEKELEVSHNIKNEYSEKIMQEIWYCLKKFMNNYNFKWYQSWNSYSPVRFNRYKENRIMDEHCDHISDLFEGSNKGIPILSILGLLNDDFEGGELIFFQNKKIEFNQGDVLIFPSNFLFPHKVEPVKKGTRYSFISWSW